MAKLQKIKNINKKHKCTSESNKKFLNSRDKRIREKIKNLDLSYVERYHQSPDSIRRSLKKVGFNIQLGLAAWRNGDFDDRIKALQKKPKKR